MENDLCHAEQRQCRYSSCRWCAGHWCATIIITADSESSLYKAAAVRRWAEAGKHCLHQYHLQQPFDNFTNYNYYYYYCCNYYYYFCFVFVFLFFWSYFRFRLGTTKRSGLRFRFIELVARRLKIKKTFDENWVFLEHNGRNRWMR